DHTEVRHGHGIAVHRIVAGDRPHAVDAMRHDLVAVEIEVHPVGVAASLLAAENAAVEGARLLDVGDREGEMEGPLPAAGASVTARATAAVSRVAYSR